MMYFNNAGWLLSLIYPSLVWKKKEEEKVIYLTFDDGPIRGVTEYVLEELEYYQAKATFFCVGENITKHPEVFRQILKAGHRVGNHTFNHLKGWETADDVYTDNIVRCEEVMNQYAEGIFAERDFSKVKLFRPPYGLIKRSQIRNLKSTYQIIMWDVLTGDFNPKLSPQQCLDIAVRHTSQGAIIIFHDSLKAEANLRYALPRFLKHFTSLGYTFKTL